MIKFRGLIVKYGKNGHPTDAYFQLLKKLGKWIARGYYVTWDEFRDKHSRVVIKIKVTDDRTDDNTA